MPARVPSLLALSLMVGGCAREQPSGPWARARTIGTLDEGIGGDKAIAQPGDLVLENDRLRVAILAGRNSMGPGLHGGSLVDADLQWQDAAVDGGRGRDQWNEMFPTFNMNIPLAAGEGTVWIEDDGSDGGAAVVRVHAKGDPFLTMLWALWGPVSMPAMWITHDYVAEPGVPWIRMKTVVTFQETAEPVTEGEPMEYPIGGLDVMIDGVERGILGGDFFLPGGSLDVFAPGIGFDEDGAVFEANESGRNIFADPFEFPWLACVGDGISYGIVPSQGSAYVPLFTASQTVVVGAKVTGAAPPLPRFAPDRAFSYERTFVVGQGDVGSVVDAWIELQGLPHGSVRGVVVEQGTRLPMSKADVIVYRRGETTPFSQWLTDVRPDDERMDGSFGGKLPVGDWELMFHRAGRPDSPRIPVRVDEGGEVSVLIEAPRPGLVTFTIRDETGAPVPAKLTVFREDRRRPSTRQPILGDGFIAGDPEFVVFADQGVGELELPDGRYSVVASRGLEYELDVSEPFEVSAIRSYHLDLDVFRSIDTQGWVSADLHVHSAPSHDSGVTLPDRVRTMVAEGVEFFAGTDHDFITDFQPVIESMGLQDWVQSTVGLETTTIEQGHFLGFPLQKNWLGDNGGALDWQGLPPQGIIDGLREQGRRAGFEPVVFIGHPRDGILGYFDQYGFDPFAGAPGAPSFATSTFYALAGTVLDTNLNDALYATLDADALELFTSKRLDVHRTPTQVEVDAYNAGQTDAEAVTAWAARTMEEQEALSGDVYRLSPDLQGNVDDWFTLLNLGYRHTAIANSDTHGLTSTEAGCPRNWVMSPTDTPGMIDAQDVADAVREHRVVASYGPFVQLWVEGAEIGSEVVAQGPVDIRVEVQAPSWVDVDRVELYENGTLVQEWEVTWSGSNLRFSEATTREPARDAWYVVVVMGDESLEPVFTPVEIPYIPLDEAVTGALGRLTLFQSPLFASLLVPVRYPKKYPVFPYALTNPVWVDVDGGGWEPPGRPAWLKPAIVP